MAQTWNMFPQRLTLSNLAVTPDRVCATKPGILRTDRKQRTSARVISRVRGLFRVTDFLLSASGCSALISRSLELGRRTGGNMNVTSREE
jgi:hypothetical protein